MEMDEYPATPDKNIEIKRTNRFFGHTQSTPTISGGIFIIFMCSLYGIVYLIDDMLPTPLYISDEEFNKDRFIAERAQHDLKELLDIGPRITGTDENEILAVKLLKQKILDIMQSAHANQKIEFDLQVASGTAVSYPSSVHIYENIQNLIVKMHARKYSEHALLINTHFDSSPTSPGGSDDGINCAVALEVLRKLAQSPITFDHNVIFLFNSGEELGLLGARGFVTQHRWAREAKVVVNLEANGAGGKIMLFQTGPEQPWLIKYFSRVAFPYAQVAAEELFQSGRLPFATDFAIFRKLGRIVGFDFAFIKNAQRYHTRYDDANIPLGSYQHAGDVLLNLVRTIANATEIVEAQKSRGNVVFYDLLGLFLIHYSETIAVVIHVVVSLLSLLTAIKSAYDFGVVFSRRFLKYLVLTTCGLLLGWILAGIFVTITALCIKKLDLSMAWYRNSWVLLGVYVAPTSAITSSVILLFKRFVVKDLTYNMHTQILAHFLRIIWTLILFVGTCMGVRSTYIILMPVFFQTCAFILIHATCSQYTARTWQILYFICAIFPTMFLMYFVLLIIPSVTSTFGHLGVNPEVQIALLCFFFTILITSVYVPFITVLQRPYLLLGGLMGIFVIFFILLCTSIMFPYSDNSDSPALQRFTTHYENTIVRTGINNDIYGRSTEISTQHTDCNSERTLSQYIKTPKFVADTDLIPLKMAGKLHLNSKTYQRNSEVHYNFTVEGPSEMVFQIKVEDNATITGGKIYLTNKVVILKGNTTSYNVYYYRGKESLPLTVSLKVFKLHNSTESWLRFSLKAFYYYDFSNITIPYYDTYLSQFPKWTNVDARLVVHDSWIY